MPKKQSYSFLTQRIKKLEKNSPRLQIKTPAMLYYGKDEYPFFVFYISQDRNPFQQTKANVCLSAGIHGDEPGGIEAIFSLMENPDLLSPYLEVFNFMIFPCLNPSGYEYRRRENRDGIDLNRQFKLPLPPLEVSLIRESIRSVSFVLHMDFHEDIDTQGFYLYEVAQKGENSYGDRIIESISNQYPINFQEKIEGMLARNGVIGRDEQNNPLNFREILEGNPNWPLAFYFFSKGTPHSITCETPVHLKISERVEMHITALRIVLDALRKEINSQKGF